MSRNKSRRPRGRGKRSCTKRSAPKQRPCRKQPTYPHPLTTAMADLLGSLMDGGRRAARSGHKVLWTPALLCVCAVLMSWDPSPTLGERFEKAGLSLANLLPRRKAGGTYQGLVKALRRNGTLHRKVADCLRERMRLDCGPHWLRQGWCAFAADGSKLNCPRTAANEKFFGCAGKKGKTQGLPQQFLTMLWHMGSGLPWAWESGVAKSSERAHLLSMLGLLPAAALLVIDAGFVGYDLLKSIARSKHFFLVRIGSNVALLRRLGLCAENDDTVYLWPQYDRRKPTRRQRNPPMPLRLIRLQRPGRKTVYLLSNVSEEEKLTVESARLLYELRWGVRGLLPLAEADVAKAQAPQRRARAGDPGTALGGGRRVGAGVAGRATGDRLGQGPAELQRRTGPAACAACGQHLRRPVPGPANATGRGGERRLRTDRPQDLPPMAEEKEKQAAGTAGHQAGHQGGSPTGAGVS